MVALFTIALFFGTVSVAMLLRSLGEPFVTAWWLTLGSVVCLCFFVLLLAWWICLLIRKWRRGKAARKWCVPQILRARELYAAGRDLGSTEEYEQWIQEVDDWSDSMEAFFDERLTLADLAMFQRRGSLRTMPAYVDRGPKLGQYLGYLLSAVENLLAILEKYGGE
jgi:hypothetical protein